MALEAGRTRPPLRPGLALRRTDLGGVSIVYDDTPRRSVPQLQARDMEIMRALWRYTFLTTSQIGETWWPERHPSRPQIRLTELAGAGLVSRFRPLVKRGTHQWIYQLARGGFRAAQKSYGPQGTYIDDDARWSERRAADMQTVEQLLRVNGWMLAYRLVLGDRLLDWRGPREARTAPPDGTGAADDQAVAPGAAALIDLGGESPPLELMIELARDERPVRLAERLRRYDRFLSGWWRAVPRLRHAEVPPGIVLVAQGYRQVDGLLRAAHRAVGVPARGRLVFCAEADIHRGALRAWMLPPESDTEDFVAIEVELPS